MDFSLPTALVDYLKQLDEFIEAELKPLEQADDNIRFYDHRREHARTDWDRDGQPNAEWEDLQWKADNQAFQWPLLELSTQCEMPRLLIRKIAAFLFGFLGPRKALFSAMDAA